MMNTISTPLPTKKNEAWKYTSLKSFSELNWKLAENFQGQLSHEDLKTISTYLPSNFYNFVFINGFLSETLSDDLEDLIEIKNLNLDLNSFKSYETEKYFLDLNRQASESIHLNVRPQQVVEKPVQILFVQCGDANQISQAQLHIALGSGSQAKIVLQTLSLNQGSHQGPQTLNLTTKVILNENSNLKFILLQNEKSTDFHFSRTEFELHQSAQLISLDLALGAGLSRHYLSTSFKKSKAFAGVYGLSVLNESQHTDHYTFIHHEIGDNKSVQHYKSILSDAAESVFRGRVRIEPSAQKANSEQLNNNLLLTKTAHAESIPQLEIYADDVKAGHGSTMGQMSADEIFYFLSRGISQTQALKMLSLGYVEELVLKIENKTLQEFILKSLTAKLGKMINV